jgi:DMSO reductase anchor subunit
MKRSGKSIQQLFTPAYLACLLVIVGEILGRFLFYAAHIRTGL